MFCSVVEPQRATKAAGSVERKLDLHGFAGSRLMDGLPNEEKSLNESAVRDPNALKLFEYTRACVAPNLTL